MIVIRMQNGPHNTRFGFRAFVKNWSSQAHYAAIMLSPHMTCLCFNPI